MVGKSKAKSTVKGRKPLWLAIVVIIAWLGISSVAGPTFGKLSTVQENDNAAFLPDSAESTLASKITIKFSDSDNDQIPTLLLFLGDVNPATNPANLAKIQNYLDRIGNEVLPETGKPLSTYFVPGFPIQAIPSADGKAALVNISLNSEIIEQRVEEKPTLSLLIDFMREDLKKNFEAQELTTHVTGFGGIFADLFGAFGSIDSTLLLTTLLVVSIILIVVYRSPLLWILPLFSAITALSLAGTIVYFAAKADLLDLNGQSLTFLPALLVVFGRWIFWPKIPRFDDVDEQLSGTWAKIGNAVERNPKRIWISTALLLTVLAGFSFTLKADGLANTEAFTKKTDSVIGLERLGEHFPSGEGSPVEIVVKQDDVARATAALLTVENISSVEPVVAGQKIPGLPTPPVKVVEGKVLLNATLKVAPDSVEARNTIPVIREAVHAVDKEILVGGGTAVQYDTDVASRHDNRIIIPVVLVIIGIILGLLLRSIVAAALLLLTVVLSFMATLGVCQLVFEHVFNFAGADASFPLFTFIFLVALGIDYNIFLMTRVREESIKLGTRRGVIKGLTVTGGVITSAGIVLAATFAVLGVLPLVFLAQLGFAVAFGVLLDTIIVRSLLVPALVHVIGPKIWWPSKLQYENIK